MWKITTKIRVTKMRQIELNTWVEFKCKFSDLTKWKHWGANPRPIKQLSRLMAMPVNPNDYLQCTVYILVHMYIIQ